MSNKHDAAYHGNLSASELHYSKLIIPDASKIMTGSITAEKITISPEVVAALEDEGFIRMTEVEERRARAKGHRFTRRTYRRARTEAINELIDAHQNIKELIDNEKLAARYGTAADYPGLIRTANQHALQVQAHAERIVARGRREKGLWT